MSNFSKTFANYLRGYIGSNALAMPPLMSSIAVTTELRAMSGKVPPVVTPKIVGDLKIVGGVTPATKIPIIKAIREITYLGLKEAKDVADEVQFGIQKTILTAQPDRVEAAAKLLREAGCVVEVS